MVTVAVVIVVMVVIDSIVGMRAAVAWQRLW